MKLSLTLAVATLFAFPIVAQDAKPTAASRYQELQDAQMSRMKAAGRDQKAREAAMTDRAADLDAFLGEFGTSPEANKARVEIATIGAQVAALADKGKKALHDFMPKGCDVQTVMQAVSVAKRLGADGEYDRLIDGAIANASSVDDKMQVVLNLKLGLKDVARAEKVLAATEAAAKTDEDKAAFLMGKATMVRYENRDDKKAYQDALTAVVQGYAKTKAGTLAANKLAAANLGAGSDPIAFKVKDLDGKDIGPASFQGKVLLIDFWATWCGPCMRELPNVKKAYAEYHDKGFEILGISLDREGDLAKLKKVIADNDMSWHHVFDGKYWQAEVAVMHDVQSIPFTILIGKDGKVVGTNLRGEALGTAVAEALAK